MSNKKPKYAHRKGGHIDQIVEDRIMVPIGVKVTQPMADSIRAFAEKADMTVYELMQYFCATVVAFNDWKSHGKEIRDEVLRFAEVFCIDHPEMPERLRALRHIFHVDEEPENNKDRIKNLVVIHTGGVMETFDPTPTDEYMSGTVTIDHEKAVRLCLFGSDKVPDIVRNVMADRRSISVYDTIMQLFIDENKMLNELTDDILHYSQTEYGNVPSNRKNPNNKVK